MAHEQMVMYEQEFKQIATICERLTHDSHAKAVLLIDKNGQHITSHGDLTNLDTTSLASLTAGNIAATSGMAQLIGEKEFPNIFHEGERDNIHLSVVAQRAILVVMFDKRSSLGLVRLRVKKGSEDLAQIFAAMRQRDAWHRTLGQKVAASHPIGRESSPSFSAITEDDIDNLFDQSG